VAELSPNQDAQRPRTAAVRAAEVAGQQWGVIGRDQLRACVVSDRAITRWRKSGKLHDRHPGVYSYGHTSVPIEGELVAALIYAGVGAVLSHLTAAWWWGLIEDPPAPIEVSTPTRTRSLPEVLVHHPRAFEHTRHRRFPITTVAQTLLDLAATSSLNHVRQALAKADYLKILDHREVEAILGRGKRGASKLRRALRRHQPLLARTRSRTERLFLYLWEKTALPMPETNVKLHGWRPDFFWRAQRLVVEIDGHGNHHTPAQIDRDRRMDMTLRGAGIAVNRYSRQQVEDDGQSVVADAARTFAALEGGRD
jgi:very-short-patch-repair endonuclease